MSSIHRQTHQIPFFFLYSKLPFPRLSLSLLSPPSFFLIRPYFFYCYEMWLCLYGYQLFRECGCPPRTPQPRPLPVPPQRLSGDKGR